MALIKAVCLIRKCKRQFVSRIDSPYCPQCRRNIVGWAQRPAQDILDRADDLERWSERNRIVAGTSVKNNVVAFRRDMGKRRHG